MNIYTFPNGVTIGMTLELAVGIVAGVLGLWGCWLHRWLGRDE